MPKTTKADVSSKTAKTSVSSSGAKPKINPNAGHRKRLKERFLEYPRSLQDHELLELLLAYIYPRKDTKPMAKEALSHFGNLRGFLDASFDALEMFAESRKGIVIALTLFKELTARYAESPLKQRLQLSTPEAVALMARTRLGKLEHEECWLALVDSQNKLIEWKMILRGSTSEVHIQPKDVFDLVFKYKCNGFILVHNHPAGSTKPSAPDIALTHRIKELAKMTGIRFADHIIVTENDWYSFNKNGIL